MIVLKMRAKRLRSGANLNSLSSFEDARLLLDENINMVCFKSINNHKQYLYCSIVSKEEYLSAEKSKKKSSKAKKGNYIALCGPWQFKYLIFFKARKEKRAKRRRRFVILNKICFNNHQS